MQIGWFFILYIIINTHINSLINYFVLIFGVLIDILYEVIILSLLNVKHIFILVCVCARLYIVNTFQINSLSFLIAIVSHFFFIDAK